MDFEHSDYRPPPIKGSPEEQDAECSRQLWEALRIRPSDDGEIGRHEAIDWEGIENMEETEKVSP